jgi:peroxiredoxin
MDSHQKVHTLLFAPLILSLLLAPLFATTQIGAKAPGFRLQDARGEFHALDDYGGKIVVLEFWSFKCAVSLAYVDRMEALTAAYRDRGVVFLAVDSNENESPLEVRRNAENLHVSIPVLMDQDARLADSLGATHTPSLVILDRSGIIRYRGAIDNNKRTNESGRIPYAEETIEAMLTGKEIPQAETRVFGCSIRR